MIKSEAVNGSNPTPPILTNKSTSAHIPQPKQQLLRPQQLQQQQQLQAQQLKQKLNIKNYHFASSTEEILRKYSKYPASLSLHIYENHYRFNNSQDSQIIPKNSPMIKNFMNHVLKEEIPVEMSELLKDFAIKSYDGCLILQVYDHRNMIKTFAYVNRNFPSPTKDPKSSEPMVVMKPRTYRTLLRPTPLSIYYDLLYHTDSALTKFTDTLSLQMESEILTLTNRELDLSVKLNPYDYAYLRPDTETEEIRVTKDDSGDEVEKVVYSHREAVDAPSRKIHQDELVFHKSSEYEELMILLSNKNKRFEETQDKKLVIVNSSTLPTTSTAQSVPVSKPTSKENSVGADGKSKKNDKTTTQNIPPPVTISTNPVRATGQFMRLRLIEEIRKKRELEKSQQEAKIHAQANSIQNDMTSQPAPELPPQKPNNVNGNISTPAPSNKRQNSASQTQPNKRGKKETKKSIANQSQSPQSGIQQISQFPPESQLPLNNGVMSSTSTSQIPSSKTTPMIPNPGVPLPQQQLRMSQNNTPQQIPMGTPNMGQAPIPQQQQQQQPQSMQQTPMGMQTQQQHPQQRPQSQQPQLTLQQQQHQQIFQNSLTLEEQQIYKQIQSKMQALAMMGQSGVAPNGQQLSAQHKQQALQQVKVLQQQLLNKFPTYFQRLKQFQMFQQKQKQLQQQKQQQQQQQQQQQGINGQQQQPMMQNGNTNGHIPIPQQQQQLHQNQQFNNQVPPSIDQNLQQQQQQQQPPPQPQPEPKKKRTYKKKTAQT
ncbi:SPT20 [Candida pseudojiufengensis]|uniref:SPT20 n=1 Tax=Candida pseudojiufengensis TaxID=497109 RepID=UPI002223F4DF|nr:SPT20 [Candida pseudojiufengensis]KAI5960416.1 SPT20 [Candida pseudojiufengensis]